MTSESLSHHLRSAVSFSTTSLGSQMRSFRPLERACWIVLVSTVAGRVATMATQAASVTAMRIKPRRRPWPFSFFVLYLCL